MDIEYYKLLKYINQIVIGQKIPSESKIILGLMLSGGGSSSFSKSDILITPQSLEAIDQSNQANKDFLKLIGDFFGQKLVTYANALVPIASLILFESNEKMSGSRKKTISNSKYILLPIIVIIAGYQIKDEMRDDNFNILVTLCLCYKIYLLTINSVEINEFALEDLFQGIFSQNSSQQGGSNIAQLLNPLNFPKMITSTSVWILSNIRTYISNSFNLMKDWISSPNKSWNSFYSVLYKIVTGIKSDFTPEQLKGFKFNGSTGHIEYTQSLNGTIETIVTPKIKMYIKYNQTTYTFDGKPMDTISYIDSRPVASALILAYTEKQITPLNQIGQKPSQEAFQSKYLFEIEPDNSVKIYLKSDRSELESIQTSVNQWLGGEDAKAQATTQRVCKEMFGLTNGLGDPICSNYFYSVLGKSILNMIKTIGAKIQTSADVVDLILSSNPAIKYELLKKLDWNTISTNGIKKLVDYSQWVNTQHQVIQDYLKTTQGLKITPILEQLVQDVNQFINLFEYNNQLETQISPITSLKKRSRRLTPTQVASLRSRQIEDTSRLIRMSVESINFSNQNQINQKGGGRFQRSYCFHEFNTKLNTIKYKLSGGNKVLSANTESKLVSMIGELDQLEQTNSSKYPDQLIRVIKAFGKISAYIN